MRTWRRALAATMCGYCEFRPIAQGEPILFIKLPNVKRERQRCTDCAGEAPPDLPPLLEAGQRTKKFQPMQALVADWKLKQAGEREPGCDDE